MSEQKESVRGERMLGNDGERTRARDQTRMTYDVVTRFLPFGLNLEHS